MNKESFLEELRGHLQILEEQEQQDILEEYSQHIDMKIQKGLSEEEAIRDFGPMKELAAEILEAYHVKPGYEGAAPQKKALDLTRLKVQGGGKAIRRTGGFVKEKLKALGRGIKKAGQWTAGRCRAFAAWLTKPFRKKKETIEPEAERRKKVTAGRLFGAAGHGIAAAWRALLALCRWCLRLCWNLFWLFLSVSAGCLTLLMIFCFGAAVILLPQGYPLVGVVIICLGAILCGGAFSLSCFSLIRRRKQEKVSEPEEAEETKDLEEVQYE